MMEEIRAGKLDCVIVKDLTRFGRNFGESGKYIEHVFPFLEARFISVNDGIDSANKKGRSDDIVVPFLNLISDAYCRDISIKIRSQFDIKRKKGDFVGVFAVYGYKRGDDSEVSYNRNRLVIDEPAADVVRMIFSWKLDGLSAEGISNKLNTLGIPLPMAYKQLQGLNYSTAFATLGEGSTKWSAVAIFRILKDETYTGVLVQGKVATPNHKVKKKFLKPTADWARVDGMHDPIVDLADFNIVGRLLERDTRTPMGSDAVYPFSGMVRCGLCGENMIRKTSHSGGKTYVYLVCCRRCKGVRIKEDLLTECVTISLKAHIKNVFATQETLKFIDSLSLKKSEVKKLDGQVIAKHEELERYNMLIFSIYENLQKGVISEEAYRQMYAHYTTLRNEAEQSINNFSHEIEHMIESSSEKNLWFKRFEEYQDFVWVS